MEPDEWSVSLYMRELVSQTDAAVLAVHQYDAAMAARSVEGAFAAVRSLMASGAMISKLLWPMPGNTGIDGKKLSGDAANMRAATVTRGARLRKELKIRAIPILQDRKVRNALEHFDERLDRHLMTGELNVVDRNVAPKGAIVEDGNPPRSLRAIDPGTATVSVGEDEVQLPDLIAAILQVGNLAKSWLTQHGGLL